MTSHVAVLSDIHGVLPALEAVLAEPDVRAADRIVLTGDLAAGPLPVETLDALEALGERALWIRGNADRELAEARPTGDPVTDWAAGRVSAAQRERLAALPLTAELDVAGLGRVLFCHATPRDDAEVVLVDSRTERWTEVTAGLDAGVGTVVCGHTHVPFTRVVHGRTVVNPGSVGMPYGRAGAHWALLGPGITLRRTPYDYAAARARIAAASSFPDADAWAEEYVHARSSAEDALAAFGPRDGRCDGQREGRRASPSQRARSAQYWARSVPM